MEGPSEEPVKNIYSGVENSEPHYDFPLQDRDNSDQQDSKKPYLPLEGKLQNDRKKPSRDWSWWCVCIGLVVVGVVACVSMAVAVGSIVMVSDVNMVSESNAAIISLRDEIL